MKSRFALLCLAIVILLFSIYEQQIEFSIFISLLLGTGLLLIRLFFRPRDSAEYTVYGIFVLVYGLLTLFTQALIKDPYNDFFVHNDAAWSFYKWTMDEVVPLKWSELVQGTIFNPAFYEYALAELLFGAVAKVAVDIGVDNVRLALRCISFLMGAIINVALVSMIIKNGVCKKEAIRNIVIFGCCSYLFITSAVFSRDIFVCLIYSLICYVFLVPRCSFRFIKLLLLCACAFGGRPENGAFAIVFMLAYYLSSNTSKAIKSVLITMIVLAVAVFVFYSTFVADTIASITNFGEETKTNTGGVFEQVYSLPFPINQIAMVIYMLIQPLPMEHYIVGEGNSWLTFPFILSPYLTFLIVICCLWYATRHFSRDKLISYFIWVSIFGFCLITFVSPDLRRSFATIPGLFGAYCLVSNKVPVRIKGFTKKLIWPSIFIINLFFQIYVMSK